LNGGRNTRQFSPTEFLVIFRDSFFTNFKGSKFLELLS
jgi:hypothetical protein